MSAAVRQKVRCSSLSRPRNHCPLPQSHFCVETNNEKNETGGTSAIVETELDSVINQYSGIFNNPFLAWGRYRKGWLKTTLPISFQFHHAQMDGRQAARFLKKLQEEIISVPQ
ncbi:MAG: hypothetical protein J6035_03465 [Bacteroidaceae bacterium]|nr:hypothetical protein [Bacteroidaceae bacterium]